MLPNNQTLMPYRAIEEVYSYILSREKGKEYVERLPRPRRHPNRGEINLAATPGKWSRFPEAKEWLDKALREQTASVQRIRRSSYLRVADALARGANTVVRRISELSRSATGAPN